ncbi:5,6-dimethylbenzimidazole synthase [Dasania sp. GY-MA-18]|uniref:5,6-dimethylbenzimidazole synthase n=1 Tax=Dasania phycosphaerae TaxID=2950436 RepID=A0A9J6RJR4_9GAMM|nr:MULTISPECIES: 5,6-dimethylbenzimidazole synthase [Dasania]MCR8922498.1 5,6-dimethylbenzimidazole synthase [Dasania sp. GY-MA-18]MCZ0864926.1 5,6-dimethylbenzimidazole synthase [Dasania phycosphaerae]MCZ0868654.1 5,6-dimethylbenzimidazole synthase [Dasania phycosphaerae]
MSQPLAFTEAMRESVYKAIFERRDMRHFNGQPMDEAIMQRLFTVAHAAPSVGFMQPWRFIRVQKPELRQQLHQLVQQETLTTAEQLGEKKQAFLQLKVQGILDCSEVVVVTLMDKREQHVFGRRTLPEMDVASAACAIQNMWLAARAEGIGLGWVSLFEPQQVSELLQIPEQATAIAILCIGPVDEFYQQPMLQQEQWAQRGDLNHYIMNNGWDEQKAQQAQQQWGDNERN